MIAALIVIALVLCGLLSRARFVKNLNSRRFMPVIYAAAAIYFGVRAYGAVSAHALVWPHALVGVIFLAGVIESARVSGIFRGR